MNYLVNIFEQFLICIFIIFCCCCCFFTFFLSFSSHHNTFSFHKGKHSISQNLIGRHKGWQAQRVPFWFNNDDLYLLFWKTHKTEWKSPFKPRISIPLLMFGRSSSILAAFGLFWRHLLMLTNMLMNSIAVVKVLDPRLFGAY